MGIDKTNRGGKRWGERLMRKHPLLNISFRTLFDWCGIYVLLPLKSRFLASIRFHHCFFKFFTHQWNDPSFSIFFVAGTSRGSSKRNFLCFGFFFVSNFIKSIFSPPSLSTAIRHLRRSSLLNLPFAVLPLPSVLMGYCKLQFKLPFH